MLSQRASTVRYPLARRKVLIFEKRIASDAGVLLRGNADTGFKIATDVGDASGDECALQSLAWFEGTLYAGGENGVFALRSTGRWDAMKGPVNAPINPSSARERNVKGVFLRVVQGGLWAFGYDTISVFDGRTWTSITVRRSLLLESRIRSTMPGLTFQR